MNESFPRILHINTHVALLGGTETYLLSLMQACEDRQWPAWWAGVQPEGKGLRLSWHQEAFPSQWFSNHQELLAELKERVEATDIEIIHIHSISDPALIRGLYGLRPLYRSMHEPRMFCPGTGKFWRFSERACTRPFGLHCLWHAYSQGCCNRHPKRLIPAYVNTRFEIKEGAHCYERIFAMSEFIREEAIQAGLPANKIELNPYFTTEVPESELQFPANPRRVVFLGRLIVHKGTHYLLEAMIPLLKLDPDLRLDIAGEGEQESKLKARVVEVGLQDQVIFHGWQSPEQARQLIAQSYMVTFPSIYPEAFGIVGIEAMMQAKPVVAFNVGGVSTWLQNAKTGFLVPLNDKSAFQDKVKMLLDSPQLQANFAVSARERALEHFVPAAHLKILQER